MATLTCTDNLPTRPQTGMTALMRRMLQRDAAYLAGTSAVSARELQACSQHSSCLKLGLRSLMRTIENVLPCAAGSESFDDGKRQYGQKPNEGANCKKHQKHRRKSHNNHDRTGQRQEIAHCQPDDPIC